jgi:U3 small nucleolar ribonucleoprotein component
MPLENTSGSTLAVIAAIVVPLIGLLTIIANGVLRSQTDVKEARNEAVKTRKSITTVEQNTEMFSDGLPGRMDEKLTSLIRSSARMEHRLSRVENSIVNHLEWHVDNGGK